MPESEIENEVELEKVARSVFGISSRRYRQMANEQKVPPVIKGKIDFDAASKSLIEYYKKLAEAGGDISLQEERRLKVIVERKLKELELMVQTKELISREEMINDELGMAGIFKATVLSFHRSLPPILVGMDAREMDVLIKKEVLNMLNRLSRMRRKK
jgi:hypothetical protein